MDDIVFCESAAGRYLGGDDDPISDRTMQRWRQEGTGPAFVVIGSRLIRYRKSDLDAYMAANRRAPITNKAA